MNKKILLILGSIAGLVLIFIIAMNTYRSQESERLGFIAQDNFKTFVRDYSPKSEAENPKVYLVEFMDPECESCRRFHPHLKMILSEFEGKVQLVVRYATFHNNSVFAVKILEAARKQEKYWAALEVLFHYQPQWGSHHNPRPELIWQYLPDSGVDVEKIRKDMNDPEILKRIAQDQEDGTTLGVRGTPTFFINGRPLDKFGPEYLREAIVKALEE